MEERNTNTSSTMPTGIYSAVDQLTGRSLNGQSANGQSATGHAPSGQSANGRVPGGQSANGQSANGRVPGGVPKTVQPHITPGEPSETRTMVLPAGRRSLTMQARFIRVLAFAAWLFVRVLFWQVYARRYFPDWVDRTNLRRWTKYARQYSRFAIALGGVHIKAGQFISTRVDALPEQIIRELEGLQDEVPTVDFKKVRHVIETDLGPINTRYAWFNETPIAAASLGQVHRAHLMNGDKVVVKVQRPGIREICYTDLAAMRIVATIASRFGFISRRADPVALVEEFGRVLLEELSYEHEARNAARFAAIYEHDMGVYIPTFYPEHSTDRVLTLEDVTSIKITDFAALERAGISRKIVAKRLMDTYLRQTFEHFIFHADPHPGNLFVYPLPLEDGEVYREGARPFYLIFIDFGMTGTLTRQIADGMVNTLAAVLNRDPHRLVQSYNQLGFILPGADLTRIEEATRAAFDTVWGLSMTEMRELDFDEVQNVAAEFNDLIKTMPFYIPQDFIYLGRTISILSGMCTNLDPSFNPWHELEPYARRLVAKGFGVNVSLNANDGNSILRSLFNGDGSQILMNLGQRLVRQSRTPDLALEVMEDALAGNIRVIVEPSPGFRQQFARMERQAAKTNRLILFGSLLIAATLLYTAGETSLALAGYGLCALGSFYGFLKG